MSNQTSSSKKKEDEQMTKDNVNTIQLDIEKGHQFQTGGDLKKFFISFQGEVDPFEACMFYVANTDRGHDKNKGALTVYDTFGHDNYAPYTILELPDGYSFKPTTIQLDIEKGHQFKTSEELLAFLRSFEDPVGALLFYHGDTAKAHDKDRDYLRMVHYTASRYAPYTILRLPEGYAFKQPKPIESKED